MNGMTLTRIRRALRKRYGPRNFRVRANGLIYVRFGILSTDPTWRLWGDAFTSEAAYQVREIERSAI